MNGARSPDMSTINHGAMLTITCNTGYTASGATQTTCTDGALAPDISGTVCNGKCDINTSCSISITGGVGDVRMNIEALN